MSYIKLIDIQKCHTFFCFSCIGVTMTKNKNATYKSEPRNQRVSARVTQDTKATIEANNMSYGDALEMLAGILKNEKSVRQYEYDSLKYENEMLKSRIKANENRMLEIKNQMSDIDLFNPDNPVLSRLVANHRDNIEKDYNGNIEKYFNSKMSLLKNQCRRAGINSDDVVDALNEIYSS